MGNSTVIVVIFYIETEAEETEKLFWIGWKRRKTKFEGLCVVWYAIIIDMTWYKKHYMKASVTTWSPFIL